MAYYDHEVKKPIKGSRLSDRAYFWACTALFAVIIFIILIVSAVFMNKVWLVGDTGLFYKMAEVIVSGGTPYIDFKDPKPPLIFFILTLPVMAGQQIAGGLLLVGIFNLISTVFVMKIVWELYGRFAGLMAGILFTLNMGLMEGYFIITEPFTVTFMVLSTYALMFRKLDRWYVMSGIFAGLAIGFKQYALLLIPLSLIYLGWHREWKGIAGFLIGTAIPLVIMFGAIFLAYGGEAGTASLYWSFGVAPTYFTQDYMGDVPGYKPGDAVAAMAFYVLGISLFSCLLLYSVLSYLRNWPPAFNENYVFLCGLAFAGTLVIRPFLHYWALALPFIVILCAKRFRTEQGLPVAREDYDGTDRGRSRLSGGWYFAVAMGVYTAVLGVFSYVAMMVMEGRIMNYEIECFYGLAHVILTAVLPYTNPDPVAPLLEYTLSTGDLFGHNLLPGMLLIGALSLAGAAIVMKIAWELYGRYAGFIAGLFFTSILAWCQGFFNVTEVMTITLLLATTYGLAFERKEIWYLISGLCAGLSIVFMQLTVFMIPIFLYVLYRKSELIRAPIFVAGALIPVVMVSGIMLLAAGESLFSAPVESLGVSVHYLGQADMTKILDYYVNDPVIAMIDLSIALSIMTSLLVLALASFYYGESASVLESYFLGSSILFMLTMFLGEFMHYWVLAMPFLVLLCAKEFRPEGRRHAAGN